MLIISPRSIKIIKNEKLTDKEMERSSKELSGCLDDFVFSVIGFIIFIVTSAIMIYVAS